MILLTHYVAQDALVWKTCSEISSGTYMFFMEHPHENIEAVGKICKLKHS